MCVKTKNRIFASGANQIDRAILLVLFLAVFPTFASAQVSPERFRISDDLVEKGDVLLQGYQVSPDSLYVVYLADQDENNVVELYSFNVNTKVRTKLNPQMQSNRDVEKGFVISNDSSTVYYLSDHEAAGVNRLYRVPIDGGVSQRLNLASDGEEHSLITQSASGKYVVYFDLGIGTMNVFNVTTGLSSVLDTSFDGEDLGQSIFTRPGPAIAPNDSVVVFMARDSDQVQSYYKTPLESGEKGKLSSVKDTNTRIYNNRDRPQYLTFSADSSSLILGGYSSAFLRDDSYAWYVVSLLNTDEGLVRISPFSVSRRGYLVSDDFETLVYGVEELPSRTGFLNSFIEELYSTTISTVSWRKISRNVSFEDENLLFVINNFALSSDGAYVVYSSYGEGGVSSSVDASGGIYRVSTLGDEFQTLAFPDSRISRLGVIGYIDDSSDLLFSVTYSRGSRREIFHLSGESGVQTLLTFPTSFAGTGGSGSFRSFLLTPDASKLVIMGDRDKKNTQEIYAIHLDGSGRAKLSRGLKPGSDVDDFLLSPDGQFVVYRTDDDTLNDLGLFAASTAIEPVPADQFCFTITAKNENVLHICI